MIEILVGCETGCRVFNEAGELPVELAGKSVGPIAAGVMGNFIAVIDHQEIWHRSADRTWSKKRAVSDTFAQSLSSRCPPKAVQNASFTIRRVT
jgi:hypothetical protein